MIAKTKTSYLTLYILLLLITAIASDFGDVLILVLPPILTCFFLYESSVNLASRGTVFLLVMILFSSVRLSFLVFPGLLRGFGPLFDLAIFILVLALTLKSCAAF